MDTLNSPPQFQPPKPIPSQQTQAISLRLIISVLILTLIVGIGSFYLGKIKTCTTYQATPKVLPSPTLNPAVVIPSPSLNNRTTIVSDSTMSSPIFKNDKFGIKIYYKKNQDYEITVKDQYIKGEVTPPIDYDQSIEVRVSPLKPRGLDFGWAAINFYVQNNNLNFNLEEFKNQENYIKSKFFWGGETLSFNSKEKINKWGKDVYKLTTPAEQGGAYRVLYLLIHNNNLIVIEDYINNSNTKEEFEKILNPILDNLTFY